jgi:hypothetical protein
VAIDDLNLGGMGGEQIGPGAEELEQFPECRRLGHRGKALEDMPCSASTATASVVFRVGVFSIC